ncbi:MAG: class I adenylate-forming enzyme family protein [Xanthomonadales bacterium]|nr:class I adenylate-forming enzyme family protein [Xanthomonadales bacterium]
MFLTPQARVDDYTARGWWGDLTLDDLLQRNRAVHPDRIALLDPANRVSLDGKPCGRLTWGELGDEVDRMAAGLLAVGLVKDDIVTYQTPNVVETVVLAMACSRIGLIISPVVMPYRSYELNYILATVKPKAFITVARFGNHDHAQTALDLDWSGREAKVLIIGGNAPANAIDFDAVVAKADPAQAVDYRRDHPVSAAELFTLFWTSGTEARPKGVPRDHNHWIVNARMVVELAELREGETLLNPFPLVNIASFGLITPWLWRCGTLVLHHPFDLAVFLKQIGDEKVNYTIVAPAILNQVLKTPELLDKADLSSVRAIGSGAAPLSPWMIEQFWTRFNIHICNIYGSNEGPTLFSSHYHVPEPTDRARYFPRMGVEGIHWDGDTASMVLTRLVDLETEDEITTTGKVGELRSQGAHVFNGYYNLPEVTKNAFDEKGYYRTGDLFELAGEGEVPRYYRFVGRCKDIIVRGGMNISPAELDDLLVGHPAFKDAAVVGIPDEVLGERVCAVVVPKGETLPSVAELADWLKAKGVATFKLPQRLETIDVLPRNPMNKVMRPQLRSSMLQKLGISEQDKAGG